MNNKAERTEGVACVNHHCFHGFDESFDQNCKLTINAGEPFVSVCESYLPLRKGYRGKKYAKHTNSPA